MTWMGKAVLAYLVVCALYGQLFGERTYPQSGDSCGYGHHWRYVTADIYGSELSCEAD